MVNRERVHQDLKLLCRNLKNSCMFVLAEANATNFGVLVPPRLGLGRLPTSSQCWVLSHQSDPDVVNPRKTGVPMTDHEWRTAASEPVSRVTRSRQGPRAAGAHRSRTRFGLPRVGSVRKPAKVLALAIAALTVVGGIATAAVIAPGTNGPGLTSVGPVSATDGFPVWYKDKTGLRLENCIAQADPLCPARGPLPDETAPISFPDNYPDEGFSTLTNAN